MPDAKEVEMVGELIKYYWCASLQVHSTQSKMARYSRSLSGEILFAPECEKHSGGNAHRPSAAEGGMSKRMMWRLSVYMGLVYQREIEPLGGLTEGKFESPRKREYCETG